MPWMRGRIPLLYAGEHWQRLAICGLRRNFALARINRALSLIGSIIRRSTEGRAVACALHLAQGRWSFIEQSASFW